MSPAPKSDPMVNWIPGVLCQAQMRALLDAGYVTNASAECLDHSSLDLRIGDHAYRLKSGSVKPWGPRFLHVLESSGLVEDHKPDEAGVWTLEPKSTYLFRLREELHLPNNSGLYGQATAKSSVGRIDVLVRLIVDGMDSYEGFVPSKCKQDMYVEVTPMTFPVRIKPGVPITQLRLFLGPPEASRVKTKYLSKFLLDDGKPVPNGRLSVDLRPTAISDTENAIAFRALDGRKENPPIDLWLENDKSNAADPRKYWEPIPQTDSPLEHRLIVRAGKFHILRSKERIRLPHNLAIYCRAIDETIGEMRIHYAGFVHPFFGYVDRDPAAGTPLIFEVRGHDVDANLTHGEILARLKFYRLSQGPEEPADQEQSNPYQKQTLTLSKYFRPWQN